MAQSVVGGILTRPASGRGDGQEMDVKMIGMRIATMENVCADTGGVTVSHAPDHHSEPRFVARTGITTEGRFLR